AEEAIEKQDFAKAKELLDTAKSDISSLNDKYKARYYTANGIVLSVLSQGKMDVIEQALSSFQKAKEHGNKEEAESGLQMIVDGLRQAGVEDQQNENFKAASDK